MEEITTEGAAELLGVTKPTVRQMIERGELRARKETRGSRFRWRIDSESVQAAQGRRPLPRLTRIGRLEAEIAEMRELIASRPGAVERQPPTTSGAEVEDLRAEVVGLREALANVRTAAEHQRLADGARADVVRLLLEALAAAERADEYRRRALDGYEEALAGLDRPGHIGQM